ncbi:COP9 signalosome catalytic subunit rri1 [Mucor velutinosus]|uniref:COP9 signalosome catalytic subunit rri1 n=1 Tax=Mucor velutinosus TaxID=708070 RepID=A0AAN7I0Y1_9FUNG|nr:COP9 signalosome catalytic subunit rri1 [Mucor velutinosus]
MTNMNTWILLQTTVIPNDAAVSSKTMSHFFVDDLVCFSSSLHDHLIHVKEVIRILNKVNLILNIEKCHFAQKSINLLGFSVSEQGKTIDTRKLSNIESWPRPKTGTDVQRFLGLVNYMRDYIPKAAALMAPLDKIRNAKVITEKEWTPIMETYFQAIKNVLVSNIVLSPPNLNHLWNLRLYRLKFTEKKE